MTRPDAALAPEPFAPRHLGPRPEEQAEMLGLLGFESLDALVDAIVPADIRLRRPLALPAPLTEREAVARLREIAGRNQVWRSYLGMGYADTITPR